jgi:hypothetical protein
MEGKARTWFAETAGRALGAMEERSMCGGHRPSA